ncbi:hypothetical protein N7495_007283 [Penicillium taxi]|uniref:uncharacterized protein n=1 Tax=Penicillium taxi TaxID=168475 RepID=UPI0025458A96|nr:uncharacterized protein N7495_007283 [Penicillium taxi]KAJ5895592.1 hypothetical protein N7495_007283 [Penicillium taxi]
MSFKVPDSDPLTPEKSKSQSLWSNISTTPIGPPPSSANSFTPRDRLQSNIFDKSQFGESRNGHGDSLFTKSGGFNTNDSIFGSSFGSTDFSMPQKTQAPPTNLPAPSLFGGLHNKNLADAPSKSFGDSNGFNLSAMTDYRGQYQDMEQELEPEEEEEVMEDIEEDQEEDEEGDLNLGPRAPSNPIFLDSTFGNLPKPQPSIPAQRKAIYSNPTDAKRPKINELWAQQSPFHKTKLPPKKTSAMPAILHTLASRSTSIAHVAEPADMIIDTETMLTTMFERLSADGDMYDPDFSPAVAYASYKLSTTWYACATRSGISKPASKGSVIGPGDQAPSLVKANFLASLLLSIHHPSRASNEIASNSNPVPSNLIKAIDRARYPTPVPQVLLDWINTNHATQTNDLQSLKYMEPNPTASPNFWDIILAAVLRGEFSEVAGILRAADFNYARSALEDGLSQPGYRGIQLQNIQSCVNKALQILDSCPGFREDDWDITGPDWDIYRRRVQSAVNDLEHLAEGEDKDQTNVPVQDNRFPAVKFGGLPTFAQNATTSFTQSARMAESRVPWTIYQHIRSLYRIILGHTPTIKAVAQDWVEATIGITAWWDGEDDDGVPDLDLRASASNLNHQYGTRWRRFVDDNPRDAYLHRLELAFSHVVNEPSDKACFRVNTMNSLEVGLASVFEGNVQGVFELLQSWSLCIAAATAEIARVGRWFHSKSGSAQPMPGLSEKDLMVLSYGQETQPSLKDVTPDEILCNYAFGLYSRGNLEISNGHREGWEMALQLLSRLENRQLMKTAVARIVERFPLNDVHHVDRLVILCSEIGLEDEGRRISEKLGDETVANTDNYGLALVCFARSHNAAKVKSVVDLLISYSLVHSRAFPAEDKLDTQLLALIKDPRVCLETIAKVDEDAARIVQLYFSGYATLRRFYEIRDEAVDLKEGEQPRFKPLARKRAAAKTLMAVISSAADNIYGGLFDPDRDSAVQVDGLMALLGEAMVFLKGPTPVLSVSQQFTILSAVEDLETVTPRVFSQCEECFHSTILSFRNTAEGIAPASPRALLKKSVANFSASTFSLFNPNQGSGPTSVSSSGVLVPRPGDKSTDRARGWDWRADLGEKVTGRELLQMLRLGIASGLSFGALGSVDRS